MTRSASPGERELRSEEDYTRLYGSGPLVNRESQAARARPGWMVLSLSLSLGETPDS